MAAELAVVQNQQQALEVGFASDVGFNLLWRGAKALAASTLVPKEYINQPANCMIALNMARHMGIDPLMCMQNLYIVHGRPGWSAQFMIACFNQCGRFSSLRFRFIGERGNDSWGCQAYATELSTGDILDGPEITIGMAKKDGWYAKNGSKWQTIPEQMLRYRAAAWFIRTVAPEIAMGFHTTDELRDGGYDIDTIVVENAETNSNGSKSALDIVVDAAVKTTKAKQQDSELVQEEADLPEPPAAAQPPASGTTDMFNPGDDPFKK